MNEKISEQELGKCHSCPWMRVLGEQRGDIELLLDRLAEQSTPEQVERNIRNQLEEIYDVAERNGVNSESFMVATPSIDDVRAYTIGKQLELQGEQEGIDRFAGYISGGCKGPMTMRAGGYMATICRSDNKPNTGGGIEPASVRPIDS